MKSSGNRHVLSGLCLALSLLGGYVAADNRQKNDTNPVCSSVCSLDRFCGSRSAQCIVNVKRTSNSASVTPKIAETRGNAPFCVRVGTTIVWQSSSKNTGFVLHFDQTTPFGSQKTITGGSQRPVSVVADKEGCFNFSVSACREGAVSGMCGSGDAQIVVTSGGS